MAGCLCWGDVAVSEEALAKDNVQWTPHGHYGNVLQAFGSLGVASYNHIAASEKIV